MKWTIAPTLRQFHEECLRLNGIRISISALAPEHRYPIAELLALRLFDAYEEAISHTIFRVVCGAPYTSGTVARVAQRGKSVDDARNLCLKHNRPKPKSHLDWSKAAYVKEAIEHVVSPSEPIVTRTAAYGAQINRLRVIRNIVAHDTKSTRDAYRKVILSHYYGASYFRRPGVLLLTDKLGQQPVLERLIREFDVIVPAIFA